MSSQIAGNAGGVTGESPKVQVVLVSLRARAIDIHAGLSELADLLAQVRDGVGANRHTSWSIFLHKFDALSALTGQLCEELERAVGEAGLSHYVIHPSSDAPPMADGEIPGLLRTRREPELERDVEALGASFPGDPSPEALAGRIIEFNTSVLNLGAEINSLREENAIQPILEQPKPRPQAGASAILAALTTGAGL